MELAFADSELASITVQGGTALVRFAAAAVEQGPSGEAGYLLGLEMVLEQAVVHGDAAQAFGRVVSGELSDGVSRLPRIDLPFDGPGAWRLDLTLAQQVIVSIDARHVRVVPGDAVLRASFAC